MCGNITIKKKNEETLNKGIIMEMTEGTLGIGRHICVL